MSDIAIRVEDLSKQYHIGGKQERYRTLRDTLTDAFVGPVRKLVGLLRGRATAAANLNESIWALKDISFEVKRGEVVGIIGRNGAGKSTLLKILSRITEPTKGRAEIHGRVGSLLEVGTGFHPELTGRENIYLNGAVLGMKHAEIDQKFDEIMAFAEVEKFIDTPVKHYSSGMYLRLAFAVAAHLDPEILLVDEVLAVGDAAFQKKCLGKMGEVAKEGRTVLFVSHNMLAMQSLCERAMWLNDGVIVEDGQSVQMVSKYLQTSAESAVSTERVWDEITAAPGNEHIRLHRVCIHPEDGSASEPITVRTPVVIEFEFWNLLPGACLNPNFHLVTEQGIVAFVGGPDPKHEPVWCGRPFPVGLFRSSCHIPGDLLNSGSYHVLLFFGKDSRYVIFREEKALFFDVQESIERHGASYGKNPGAVWPLLKWTTEKIAGDDGHSIFGRGRR